MNRRCTNPLDESWDRYGGRGITVCDEWKLDFDAFCEWALNNGYIENLSIDRIDFNGNYCPSNCRWITMSEQHSNESRNVFITHNGITKTITQWAIDVGINPATALKRKLKYGASKFDEIFANKRLSTVRFCNKENTCKICKTNNSTKWRIGLCANCYARGLRWSKKTGRDIAGYATLIEKQLNGQGK